LEISRNPSLAKQSGVPTRREREVGPPQYCGVVGGKTPT